MRHGGATPGFVVREQNGVWGRAINLPGPWAPWNQGVFSVSCLPSGSCVAGGSYRNHGNQGFVT